MTGSVQVPTQGQALYNYLIFYIGDSSSIKIDYYNWYKNYWCIDVLKIGYYSQGSLESLDTYK